MDGDNDSHTGIINFFQRRDIFHFADFIFVDRLAVSPEQRGAGIGSSIMNELIGSTGKPIILEVERPVSRDAVRRIDFYEALGFHLNVFDYIRPPLEEGGDALPLFLMSYPQRLEAGEYEKVRRIIHRNVYNAAGCREEVYSRALYREVPL